MRDATSLPDSTRGVSTFIISPEILLDRTFWERVPLKNIKKFAIASKTVLENLAYEIPFEFYQNRDDIHVAIRPVEGLVMGNRLLLIRMAELKGKDKINLDSEQKKLLRCVDTIKSNFYYYEF